MSEPTAHERTSLDAHVDLCAVRYRALEGRMSRVEYAVYAIILLLLVGEGTVWQVIKRLMMPIGGG